MKRIFTFFLLTLLIPTIGLAITVLEYPKFQAFDSNGNPLSGGKVYTYEVGSGTSKATYSNYQGTTANTNPTILDARGEASIYLNGTYKIVLKDSTDSLIWTIDNVMGAGQQITSSTSGYIAVINGATAISGVQYLSGISIDPNTDILAGVSTTRTVTGKTYFCDLTSSETLGGLTMYGGAVGNYGSTAGVTATIPSAIKGMSTLIMLTQGQYSGGSIFVSFNVADTVLGGGSRFSTGASTIFLTGTTLQAFIQIDAWQNGRWYITGASGIDYRNK